MSYLLDEYHPEESVLRSRRRTVELSSNRVSLLCLVSLFCDALQPLTRFVYIYISHNMGLFGKQVSISRAHRTIMLKSKKI